MLYKDQPNTLEMAKAFLHFIVASLICVSVYLLLINGQNALYNLLGNIHLMGLSALVNVMVLIMVFIIFNTSYYAFVSYQRAKMLVFAIVFLFVGCVKLVATIIAPHMNVVSQVPQMFFAPVEGYALLADLFFALGILLSAFIPLDMKVNAKNQAIIKAGPWLGFISFALLIIPFNHFLAANDAEKVVAVMNSVYLLLLFFALTIKLILLIKENSGYLVRVCSGLLFIFTARIVEMAPAIHPEVNYVGAILLSLTGYGVIFFAVFKFNVGLPLQDLKNTEKQIKLYADNLERIIDKRTSEVRKANEKFIHELDYAKSIQQSLLPAKKPNYKDLQFVSEYFPCERLSGDFYDIYRIDEDHIGMYVLDVSGHGISAALMTMFCNNVIKSSEKLIKRYRGLKPHRNLYHFYEEFNKMNFPDEMHMVIFYASYNLETGLLTYCSGGMNCYPIVVKENGDLIYLENSKGFPICKMADFFTPEYASASIKLEKNDMVIFYTDGLVDRDKNKCLGEEDIAALLKKNQGSSLRTLNAQLTKIINANLHQIDDDITYFMMKVTKGEKNEGHSDTEGLGTD